MDWSLTKFDDLLGKYEYILVTLFFFFLLNISVFMLLNYKP